MYLFLLSAFLFFVKPPVSVMKLLYETQCTMMLLLLVRLLYMLCYEPGILSQTVLSLFTRKLVNKQRIVCDKIRCSSYKSIWKPVKFNMSGANCSFPGITHISENI